VRLLVNCEGIQTTQIHEIAAEATVQDLLGAFFEETVEIDAWVVEAESPLDGSLSLIELDVVEHTEITITRRAAVEAKVRFNGITRERSFEPQQPTERVFRWAVGAEGFNLPASQWPEHELVPAGSSDPVDPRLPVAAYIDRDRVARFDLRRKHAYQG
jgi:hypothetical protein